MNQEIQRSAEMREVLLMMRRLALEFAKWVEVRYIKDGDGDGYNQTTPHKFEARTSTQTQQTNR